MKTFIRNLRKRGQIRVHAVWQLTNFTLNVELEREILDYYRADVEAQAGGAPDLDVGVAFSAAVTLYRLTQAWMVRSTPESWIREIQDWLPGELQDDTSQYSADLFLRYLPAIYRPAQRLNATDPLVTFIETYFRKFPLASVGSGYGVSDLESWMRHRTFLRLVFLDRVNEWRDRLYLEMPWVQRKIEIRMSSLNFDRDVFSSSNKNIVQTD
jgi:hypothetical protein